MDRIERRIRRLRRAKIAMVVVSVVLGVVMVGSVFLAVRVGGWPTLSGYPTRMLGVSHGGIWLYRDTLGDQNLPRRCSWQVVRPSFSFLPRFDRAVLGGTGNARYFALLPLIYPFGACALVAALLYRKERIVARQRPGTCPKCGYDLRGIAADVCPECGAAKGAVATGKEPAN